jgi:hypothetical protein
LEKLNINKIKEIYATQPYDVGSREAKSTAAIIPKKIVRLLGIDNSTVFLIKPNRSKRQLIIQVIDNKEFKPKLSEDKEALQTHPQTISLNH